MLIANKILRTISASHSNTGSMPNTGSTRPKTAFSLKSVLARQVFVHTSYLLAVSTLFVTTTALAQVQIDTLQPAAQFDIGLLDSQNGGLDVNLWNDTSAKRATALIQAIPLNAAQPARALLDAALLSSGIPPQSTSPSEHEAFQAAKLGALIGLGKMDAYQKITARTPINANSAAFVTLNVNKALLEGDTKKACEYADSIKDKTQRKTPYWAKLRAFCHSLRGEFPAAELTSDLIKRSKHKDAGFFALLPLLTTENLSLADKNVKISKKVALNSPLHHAMIENLIKKTIPAPKENTDPNMESAAEAPKQSNLPSVRQILKFPSALAGPLSLNLSLPAPSRLAALHQGASALTVSQIETALQQLTTLEDQDDITDVKTLTETRKWSPKHWSHAFTALRTGTDAQMNTQIAATLLVHARRAGILGPISRVLAQDMGGFSAATQAQNNPKLFAQIAVQQGDIGALRALHSQLETDHPLRGRIALASDALGNGFMLNAMGRDIDARLASAEDRDNAVRDAYIALALGATLSDDAVTAILTDPVIHKNKSTQNYSAVLGLQEAANRRATAQSALWAAQVLGNGQTSDLSTHSFYLLLRALNDTGLGRFATHLAAQDFLAR